jgi:hypothetical protein
VTKTEKDLKTVKAAHHHAASHNRQAAHAITEDPGGQPIKRQWGQSYTW